MRRKILLMLEVLMVFGGMLTAQACFVPPGPYGYYGRGYGDGYGAPEPAYGYGHHWHHDWDDWH